jgi:hypothetical protein
MPIGSDNDDSLTAEPLEHVRPLSSVQHAAASRCTTSEHTLEWHGLATLDMFAGEMAAVASRDRQDASHDAPGALGAAVAADGKDRDVINGQFLPSGVLSRTEFGGHRASVEAPAVACCDHVNAVRGGDCTNSTLPHAIDGTERQGHVAAAAEENIKNAHGQKGDVVNCRGTTHGRPACLWPQVVAASALRSFRSFLEHEPALRRTSTSGMEVRRTWVSPCNVEKSVLPLQTLHKSLVSRTLLILE